jgi:hexosaminidase
MKAVSIFATTLLVCAASTAVPAEAPTHDLLPVPARIAWRPGRLVLGGGLRLTRRGPAEPRIDAALGRTAERLTRLGVPASPGPRAATLLIEAATPGQGVQTLGEDESYTLSVTSAGARLTANNPLGVLRGLETWLQLVLSDAGVPAVPAVSIEDWPRFPWRGLLLDCCRHFMPLPVVKRNLDALAAVKMNVFHWHLTEDQAFRIESRRFPRLHQQGSGGQFYTQDQVREVLAYARERGIRVVPEFDLPGHTGAWLLGHPELAASPGPFEPIRKWGIFDVSLDPSREEVYAFLEEFLTEMAGLFPDEYLHIGGDEVRGRDWNENLQEFLYAHGLRDNHALQAYFNGRISGILGRLRRGRREASWRSRWSRPCASWCWPRPASTA